MFLFSLSGYSVFSASGDIIGETKKINSNTKISQESLDKNKISESGEKNEEQNIKQQKEEKPQKIEEIQSDIKSLEKEKQRLEFKWNTFRIGNENLGDLIRLDLTDEEKINLEVFLVNYTTLKNKGDTDIYNAIERGQDTQRLQNELFELKGKLYKTLVPYIQTEKLDVFKAYIESDISYNEKSKVVATEIGEKEVARDERVEEIQEKIEDNAEKLREQIKVKMTEQLEKKLDEFIAQEKFQSLKSESKIILFERLIEKISLKKDILEETLNPTSIIEERIFLYEIVQETLQSYMENWKK